MNLCRSIAVVAVSATAFASPHAVALPVAYQLSGGGVGWATDLTAVINYSPAGAGGFSEDAWVGPLSLNVTSLGTNTTDTQMVYCTDIFNDYWSGGIYHLGLLSQTVSLTIADRIDALLSNVTPTDAIEGAALQAAIWKVENDPGNYDIQNGVFSITPDGITGDGTEYQAFITQADIYLDNVASGAWQSQPGTTVLQYTADPDGAPNQSFAFVAPAMHSTPEPASLALLGSGVAALIGLRHRRRRGIT